MSRQANGGNATLPDHLEAFLGKRDDGRRFTAPHAQPSIDIVRFADQPLRGAATYATLGLSKVLLHEAGGHIRQELLYAHEGEREPYEGAQILVDTAERAVELGAALPRGQVIGAGGPVLDGSPLEGFVCLNPGFFPEDFELFDDPTADAPVVIAMLAPIAPDEAEFISEHGYDAFVDLLGSEEPNLLDWRRPSFLRAT